MRTITITKDVYTVDELSSHAFANAYRNYLSRLEYAGLEDMEYEEGEEGFKEMCEAYDLEFDEDGEAV